VLVGRGYEVEMATDGADALRLCEQGRYDLILSDLRMRKMDGAAFYQALQAKYGPAMPRMIFVTGQTHSLDYAGFLFDPERRIRSETGQDHARRREKLRPIHKPQ
jgi:CheY-like chemotaxis protein